MIQIDITTEEDIFGIERILSRVAKISTRREIGLRLARNLRWDFLRESRVTALLATVAQDHDLIVFDWYDRWTKDDIDAHFATSLMGLAAVFYSQKVTNIAGEDLPTGREPLLDSVAARGGLLEPRWSGSRGKSITFCAFDPKWGEPAALAGTLNRQELFKRTFEKYRQKYLEVGKGLDHTGLTRDADSRLSDFVFELYQNTYEHGRRMAAEGNVLPGFRYVRLRKYIDWKRNFLARAAGFAELEEYLGAVISDDEFKFYEIAISDNGLGIIGRFFGNTTRV